jgi:hypothetical protein
LIPGGRSGSNQLPKEQWLRGQVLKQRNGMTASHYIVYDPERTFFLDLRNQLLENIMKDRICAFLKVGPVPAYKRYLQNDL